MAGMMWKIDENLTTGILCPSSLEFLSSLTNFSDITFIKKKKKYIYIYIYFYTFSIFISYRDNLLCERVALAIIADICPESKRVMN
jgi:hypothetical protein